MVKRLDYSRNERQAVYLGDLGGKYMSLAGVLESISDDKSLSIFQLIGDEKSNGKISIKKLGLSTKQYYTRISAMVETGLIKRQNGIYCITPFGKAIYCCIMIANNAVKNYYNLKGVEVAQAQNNFSNEEFTKLVDALIDSQQLKEFLTKKC